MLRFLSSFWQAGSRQTLIKCRRGAPRPRNMETCSQVQGPRAFAQSSCYLIVIDTHWMFGCWCTQPSVSGVQLLSLDSKLLHDSLSVNTLRTCKLVAGMIVNGKSLDQQISQTIKNRCGLMCKNSSHKMTFPETKNIRDVKCYNLVRLGKACLQWRSLCTIFSFTPPPFRRHSLTLYSVCWTTANKK